MSFVFKKISSSLSPRNLTKIWKDQNIIKAIKIMLMKSLLLPVLLYVSKTQSMKKGDEEKQASLRCGAAGNYQDWTAEYTNAKTAKQTNASDFTDTHESTRLSKIIYARIARYFGHVQRKYSDNSERLVVRRKVQRRCQIKRKEPQALDRSD